MIEFYMMNKGVAAWMWKGRNTKKSEVGNKVLLTKLLDPMQQYSGQRHHVACTRIPYGCQF